MKTIDAQSIQISGLNKGPKIKHAINSEEKEGAKYYDLGVLAGLSISLRYSYTEDGIKRWANARIDLPEGLDETGVRDFILTVLNQA
jgi:hypothetical protein